MTSGGILVAPRQVWDAVNDHLFQDGREHLAFLLCSCVQLGKQIRLLAKHALLVPDTDLAKGAHFAGLALRRERLLGILNTAHRQGLCAVEVHNHSTAGDRVRFSLIDERGQEELIAFLGWMLPEHNYGALVLSKGSFGGRMWVPTSAAPLPISEVRVLGDTMVRLPASPTARKRRRVRRGSDARETFHRQVLALGREGQELLRQVSVGVVGLGGTGSIVAQELAHIGIQEVTLVDDDLVDKTSLHRLAGSTPADVGELKVEVAKRQMIAINPQATVRALAIGVRQAQALDALKIVDVLFGCVDTDSGRLIVNELALAYLLPLIDVGVGIRVEGRGLTHAGGRVVVVMPGRPCLLCTIQINTRVAAEELESDDERAFRRRHGYVQGSDEPEPAVMSLNGTVASIAVTEFLALVTGFRDSRHYTMYDMLGQQMPTFVTSQTKGCVACAVTGLGDGADVQRYSRSGLPDVLGASQDPLHLHDQTARHG